MLVFGSALHAQLAPSNQTYIADIGGSPFKAPATTDFAPTASFTMEGWFFLTASTPFGWLMGKGPAIAGGDPPVSFGVFLDPTGSKLSFQTSTGAPGSSRGISTPGAFPTGVWTHVAAVLDNGVTRLLINGAVVATGTATGPLLSAPSVAFGIGAAYQANGSYNFGFYQGYARQVRFWNVGRTATQISAALSESLPTDRTGLVAAWPLDESSGGTVGRDISGAGRSLTTDNVIATRSSVLANGPFYSPGAPLTATTTPFGIIFNSIVMDFNSDGYPDLVVFDTGPATFPEVRRRLRAYRNNAGTFTDATDAVLGNVTMVNPRASFVADFNGDGLSDLLIVGHGTDIPPYPGEQSKIFIRTADGRLVDETATRLPQRITYTHSVAVADIDGDGDLDIYMGNIGGGDPGMGPRFYINNGNGFFSEATDRLPADISNRNINSNYTGSLLVDINGDGRPDLVLGGQTNSPNEVLINDGTGHFARDSRFVLPPKLFDIKSPTVNIESADFNGDGKPDLLLATSGGSSVINGVPSFGYGVAGLQLLLNRGDGTFTDATANAGFTWSKNETAVFWSRIVDLDGDGRPDILAEETATFPNNVIARVFLSRGNGQFDDASDAYRIGGVNNFVHAADFDRDGRIDFVTISPTAITVARSAKALDRDLFRTGLAAPSRLGNLSVLTNVTAADPQFTVGTVLGGNGTSGVKPLLIRAAGPSLTPLGVGGALADPKLEVFSGSSSVATNDNWNGTPALSALFSQVGAFAYASATSLDAAVSYTPNVTAPPAGFTVQVNGVGGAAGAVIAELYDATPSAAFTNATPRLINVSVLKQIGAGGLLTAGFVIQGSMPKQVLVRAVGPTLALPPFNIGSAMSDPKLDLFLGPTVIASNDNWGGTSALSAAFSNVGAFALGATSKDAALLVTLFPGNYTAQVSGVAGSTGLAIVEVYEVP